MRATDSTIALDVCIDQIRGRRDYQEDYAEAWQPRPDRIKDGFRPMLAVLADGMGGHVSGELASRTAVESYIQGYRSRFIHNESDEPDPRWLAEALENANAALMHQIQANPDVDGMGCTLVAIWLTGGGLQWVSVGDSLLLVYSQEHQTMSRLNEDHSFGALLDKQAAHNIISAEEAQSNPRRHALRSALTGQNIPISDDRSLQGAPLAINPNDWIILASDGLDTLSDSEIETILRGAGQSSAKELVHQLLSEVEARGTANQDNTTVIAIRAYVKLTGGITDADTDLEDTIPIGAPDISKTPETSNSTNELPTEPVTEEKAQSPGADRPNASDANNMSEGAADDTEETRPTERVVHGASIPAREATNERKENKKSRSKFPILGLGILCVAAGAIAFWASQNDWFGLIGEKHAGPLPPAPQVFIRPPEPTPARPRFPSERFSPFYRDEEGINRPFDSGRP